MGFFANQSYTTTTTNKHTQKAKEFMSESILDFDLENEKNIYNKRINNFVKKKSKKKKR